MRSLILLLCIVLSAAACVATGTTSTPTPTPTPTPIASKACGGYHLVIDNVGRSDVEVRLNGHLVTTVNAGQTANIAQYLWYGVPFMPWDVQVTRVSDGAVLLMVHLANDGTDGRRFEVGDVPIAEAAGVAFVC